MNAYNGSAIAPISLSVNGIYFIRDDIKRKAEWFSIQQLLLMLYLADTNRVYMTDALQDPLFKQGTNFCRIFMVINYRLTGSYYRRMKTLFGNVQSIDGINEFYLLFWK